MELGFRISMVSTIPVSLSCIMDSKTQDSRFHQKKFPNSGFQKETFRGFRNPDFLTWSKSYVHYRGPHSLTLGSRGFFFLIDTNVPRRSCVSKRRETSTSAERNKNPSREPYQKTVSTVYFILGILRTDFWSQGNVASQYHM